MSTTTNVASRKNSTGLYRRENHWKDAVETGDLRTHATHTSDVPDLGIDLIVGEIVLACRERKQILRARLRLQNQIDAQERLASGKFEKKMEVGGRHKKRYVVSPEARKSAERVIPVLTVNAENLEVAQRSYDRQIAKLAETLPAWEHVRKIRGIGALSFGLILGEAKDLSRYANPAKLWKRMGLAVMPDGKRQRKVIGAEALEHGYNPERRSLMYVIGDNLIKMNGRDGVYRQLYDVRKALELERLPADAKGRLGWAHNRASRYMQKRVLVDLWTFWRDKGARTIEEVSPNVQLSSQP